MPGNLCVAAMREGARLVGLLPCYALRREDGWSWLLLGSGLSDYLDALLDPDFVPAAGELLWRFVEACALCQETLPREGAGVAARRVRCEFQQLAPGAALLQADPPPGWCARVEAQDVCPVLALPESTAELAKVVSPSLLADLAYNRRRVFRLGRVRLEAATAENLDELFDALVRLHGARWQSRGASGVFHDEALTLFHRETLPALRDNGELRLYALRLEKRIIAIYYGMQRGRSAYFHLSGFDPAYAHLGPGTLVIAHAIEEAIRAEAREFHFLRGSESYKYRWGAADRWNCRRTLERAI